MCFIGYAIYGLELVHPSYRGLQFAILGSGYLFGQIPAAFIAWATADMEGPWAFRIPFIVAIPLTFLLLITIPTVPESPRWLVANARYDEAHAILVSYFKSCRGVLI